MLPPDNRDSCPAGGPSAVDGACVEGGMLARVVGLLRSEALEGNR